MKQSEQILMRRSVCTTAFIQLLAGSLLNVDAKTVDATEVTI